MQMNRLASSPYPFSMIVNEMSGICKYVLGEVKMALYLEWLQIGRLEFPMYSMIDCVTCTLLHLHSK